MIPVSDSRLFEVALEELSRHKLETSKLRGRFAQIFFALKFYQNQLPSMFSGQFVSTELLQQMLDDLYQKASRPANNSVLMLFEGSYLSRTGLRGASNSTTQNTWRNNLNLQKGIGCYAPTQDLASQTFLDQSRMECRHLMPGPIPSNPLAGGRCSLCATGATYRREGHRKWLKIDSGGSGYAVVDMLNVSNFLPYVAPGGKRIPILPLIVALYYDALQGLQTATRTELDISDFAVDFNFSPNELNTYFDQSVSHLGNAKLLAEFSSLSYTPVTSQAVLTRAIPAVSARGPELAVRESPPAASFLPVPTSTPAPPPGVNTGWDAEQYVASALRMAGWQVYDVSRQRVGYDLWIQRGRQNRYVDVKSSLGNCTPTLTAREWQQAAVHGFRYILAILENFNPDSTNTIYWVPNPTQIPDVRASSVVQYAIPRNRWISRTVSLDQV